ncbi:MAG: preprotein translocase subunit SecY [Candidatus Marinimicrobia bacterium]|jgi:preprotein translocase subunit SecY|nr:preprotein translocase subunit SecY [Candidatus Neomarinimicrobiota bacterium]
MMQSFKSIFKIHELRQKILFTLFILFISRVGTHIPIPGIDSNALAIAAKSMQNTLLGLYDMFAGGAFKKATIFALGIMPYISASIIIQLLGSVFPYFQRLQKEGEAGRKKITQITRYATVLLASLQAFGVSKLLVNLKAGSGMPVVPYPGLGFTLLTMLTLTAGTVFLMWLGEQITERGIGNGISLIIMVNIMSRFPKVVIQEITLINSGVRWLLTDVVLLGVMVIIIAFVVYLTQGKRKIPVQYAKRVVGRKIYGGQSTNIPLRVNTAGVMPIIFAQALVFIPNSVGMWFENVQWLQSGMRYFNVNHPVYWAIFGLLIVFFTYFYTAIAFNPTEVADNMKKHGGFIPGIRPGKRTAEYIDNILTKVTLPGSIALAMVAVFPYILMKITDVGYSLASFFGGTSLLIMVGVALDTLQQVESHLLTRHYDGFMKSGKIKGRRKF